jgi:FKBP-type peptidyl-prolyl cis-trans isomerase
MEGEKQRIPQLEVPSMQIRSMQVRTTLALLLATLALPSRAGETSTPSGVALRSSDDKILYALGLSLAERLVDFELTPAELGLVQAGLQDGLSGGATAVSLAQWAERVEKMLARRREATALREKQLAREYYAAAEREAGAIKRPSGLIYRELRAGNGPSPGADSRVRVHYHGTRVDGSVFDSSVERKQPSEFALGSVIRCWKEGVQLMKTGGKARLVCPAEIAYGQKGMPPKIKPGATLTFEIELLEVKSSTPAAAAKQGN